MFIMNQSLEVKYTRTISNAQDLTIIMHKMKIIHFTLNNIKIPKSLQN